MDVKINKDLFLRIRDHFVRLDDEDKTLTDEWIAEELEKKYDAIKRHDEYTKMLEARKHRRV